MLYSAYTSIVLLILTCSNVQSQLPYIVGKRGRYVCYCTAEPPHSCIGTVEWIRNGSIVEGNNLQGVQINGRMVRFDASLEMPRDEAIWACQVNGTTSHPRTRYSKQSNEIVMPCWCNLGLA